MTHTSTQRRVVTLALFLTLLCSPLQAAKPPITEAFRAKAQQLQQQGRALFDAGRIAESIARMEQLLAHLRSGRGDEHPEVGQTHGLLGFLYGHARDFSRAEAHYQEALAIFTALRGPDHSDVLSVLFAWMQLAEAQGRYAQVVSLAKRSIPISEKTHGPESHQSAVIRNSLGLALQRLNTLDEAAAQYHRVLQILQKVRGSAHPETLTVMTNLASIEQSRNRFAEAREQYEEVLRLQKTVLPEVHADIELTLNSLAGVFHNLGLYEGAEKLYKRALTIAAKVHGNNHPQFATTLSNLASLHMEMGRYPEATEGLQRTLDIREGALGPMHPDVGGTLNNLGSCLLEMGETSAAESMLRRALPILEKGVGTQHPTHLTALSTLAVIHKTRGDLQQAVTTLERVLELQVQALGADHPDVARTLNNLVSVFMDVGDLKTAMGLQERALAIDIKVYGKNHAEVAKNLNNLAAIEQAMGNHDEAVRHYKQSLAIREKTLGKDHPDVASSLNNLGYLAFIQGRYEEAEPLLVRSERLTRKALGDHHPSLLTTLTSLTQLRHVQGRHAQAEETAQQMLAGQEVHFQRVLAGGTEAQKRTFLMSSLGRTYIALTLASVTGRKEAIPIGVEAIHQSKGRALAAMRGDRQALRTQLSDKDRTHFDELRSSQAMIAKLTYQQTSGDSVASNQRKAALVKRMAFLEEELATASAAFRREHRSVTLNAVRNAIPNNAALLEYFVYRPTKWTSNDWAPARYVAYVLRRDGDIGWVDLGERKPIDEAVARFRKAMVAGDMSVLEHGHALHKLMMAPLMPHLQGVESLIVSPDGALNLVPFAALVDTNWEILLRRYAIRYVTNARDLLVEDAIDSREAPLIVAAPAYSNEPVVGTDPTTGRRSMDLTILHVKALPGTRKEARTLQKHLHLHPERVLLDKMATETALKAVHGPRILHIATHGFFLPAQAQTLTLNGSMGAGAATGLENPLLRTGLALAGFNLRDTALGTDDGVMTGLELAGLDLYGTELVVLSACETGLGEVDAGEGVYGLKRALVLAGSRTQVVSLWKVSDAETRALMSAYYQRLAKGEDRVEAMRQVQLSLYGEQQKHPVHWAAFVISGATGPISLSSYNTTTAPLKP